MADKYGIPSLKATAHANLRSFLATYEASTRDLAETIRIVYKSTPDSIVELRWTVFYELRQMPRSRLEDYNLRSAVQSVEGLAYDLFLSNQALENRAMLSNTDADSDGWVRMY